VWTGPAPDGAKLRRTEEALLDVIDGAKRDLLLVAYTAYKLPSVAEGLARAAGRGVRIALVAKSSAVSEGKVTVGALESLGRTVAALAKVYVWPLDQRARDDAGRHGSLHVKCAVADEDILFVSSANLTEFAVSINMELGVLVGGGPAPKRVAEHVRGLIAAGVLAEV
jgi:phosphatidylserine/phosphatidylglycerophosphate/cardiolipin synthase-like enzyme